MYNSSETSIRIKKLAKEKGIQMIELQEKCGLSKNTIMQSGKSQEGMKAKNLYAIAEMLECSVDYLLGRTDNPNTTTGNNINSVNIVNGSNGDHSPLTVNGTPEQIKMLEELDKRPIVFDEDCPELTDEQLRKAYRASDRKKQSVTVQLSAKSMEKVKSLGANSTSVLSQLLEKVLNNENLLKQCM